MAQDLAVSSTRNGYEVSGWMICHFFYIGLDLDEDAELALMRAGSLDIEGMTNILHDHWLEDARRYILRSNLLTR